MADRDDWDPFTVLRGCLHGRPPFDRCEQLRGALAPLLAEQDGKTSLAAVQVALFNCQSLVAPSFYEFGPRTKCIQALITLERLILMEEWITGKKEVPGG